MLKIYTTFTLAYDVDLPRNAPFTGGVDNAAHLRGQIPSPKKSFRIIFKSNAINIKTLLFKPLQSAWITTKFCTMINTPKCSLWVVEMRT